MSQFEKKINELRAIVGYISWSDLEVFILDTPHIWRPIKGHCFETWFDKVIRYWGYTIKSKGGDDAVDRVLDGKTLQLKTPNRGSTKENIRVAYSLHKTHGLEKRPNNLYVPKEFADFLVGQHPTEGLIICPKEHIPHDKTYPDYFADPAYFDWNNKWLNRFDLLGIKKVKKDIPQFTEYKSNKFFAKIGEKTQLSDEEIIDTLLAPENFRILKQNMRGSIREWYFKRYALAQGIMLHEPPKTSKTRERNKVDLITTNGIRIQVKGITRSISKFPVVGVEIKGSHGRIPQRLYKVGDFDYLVVVLDPDLFEEKITEKIIYQKGYNYVVIPAKDLKLHFRSAEWGGSYYKDIMKFNIINYKLNDLSLLE